MARQSVMKHSFSQVPRAEIARSSFNRNHGYRTTFDAGNIVPVFFDFALPGDTMNVQMTSFARLATPLKPFMDNLFYESFFFAVPIRLIWDNFQKFMGEQTDPGDSTDFTIPISTAPVGGYQLHSLQDYFALPTEVAGFEHSTWWIRAYNLIWNEWFRDQNLQDSVVVDRDDGPDTVTDYVLLRRGKRHDYFTSCLPWPQKGDAVEIPLGTTAPVVSTGADVSFTDGTSTRYLQMSNGVTDIAWSNAANAASAPTSSAGPAFFGAVTGLQTDLSTALAATVNTLRQSVSVQRLLERDARGGTRYTEIIKAHFGVTSPDARLQRPEYLGGGSTPININPVQQTSSTDATTPQGNLAAIGTVNAPGREHGFTKSFTEHCVVIGMVNVRADLAYQQGLNRMWSWSTRYDLFWPELAQIGEQAVLNKEIYCVGTGGATDELVFGYQERHAELRYKPSNVTGQFRSNAATPLDMWHLAQNFTALPTLDASFIVDNPPIDRVIAVPAEPHFFLDCYFHFTHARPVPTFGVPGLTRF